MKRILTVLTSCLFIAQINVQAQSADEPKTLIGGDTKINMEDLGVFIAPAFGFTSMDGSAASLFNLRGGMSIKDKFAIGGYFSTSLNQIMPSSETIPNIYMDYWTAGGFVEYTVLSKNILNLSFPLYVGYGEVQMDNDNDLIDAVELGEQNFIQIEPSALLQINLHRHVRINLGAGYRFISEMNYRNFNQSDISGFTGYVGLKFGIF